MLKHETINYLEFPAKDLAATKAFFSQVFHWSFEDYGDEYSAFSESANGQSATGMMGGFYQADLMSTTAKGGALVVLYSEKLEQTQAKIEQAGGAIVRPIFSFPGGRRFHFIEPSGNEFAVWSDRS
ncbi:glyoxalase [Photobacterium jeanii]|uniref:Glyoxalase n=1 Tax=Photobacterium jeanii TaxID=858640 RepID=A0A178K2Z3_9GAMM|nr:VOC family protein [Photobacterium jeanii]OAN11104.1 glyoxalase [Photobacterium jeanii]PST90619.1 VOC family protein [Photobacterium jeanii]